MGKALVKGCVLGGIILFIWMMISWMLLPWHCAVMGKFTNESDVASTIMANAPQDGVYILPNLCQEKIQMEMRANVMKKGPMIFTAIQRGGFDVKSPAPYIISFIIQLIGAFLVTYLLLQVRNSTYWHRVWFVTLFGIAAGVLTAFPHWNWWGFSFGYVVIEFLDLCIGWFLAGLALAVVARAPKS